MGGEVLATVPRLRLASGLPLSLPCFAGLSLSPEGERVGGVTGVNPVTSSDVFVRLAAARRAGRPCPALRL
jgi:hypothetical protein